MKINKIIRLLTQELSQVYCDNCINNEHYDYGQCLSCEKSKIKWGLSNEKATQITEKIEQILLFDEIKYK